MEEERMPEKARTDAAACGGKRSLLRSAPFKSLIAALIAQLIAGAAAILTIRNLDAVARSAGRLLDLDADSVETLSAIFRPLREASLALRPVLPVLVCFSGFLLFFGTAAFIKRSLPKSLSAAVPIWLIGALFVLISFVLMLWLTEVNGIRFGDAMRALWKTLNSGALDSLSVHPKEVPICL